MHKNEQIELTNMCMISDGQGHVLMQNRVSKDWPGLSFPGGHVEWGESFTDSVIREVREETGLTIAHPRLCGIKDWMRKDGTRYMVLCYRTEEWSGQVVSSEEGEMQWVAISDLPTLKLSKGMRSTLRLFLEEQTSEQFFVIHGDQWEEIIK